MERGVGSSPLISGQVSLVTHTLLGPHPNHSFPTNRESAWPVCPVSFLISQSPNSRSTRERIRRCRLRHDVSVPVLHHSSAIPAQQGPNRAVRPSRSSVIGSLCFTSMLTTISVPHKELSITTFFKFVNRQHCRFSFWDRGYIMDSELDFRTSVKLMRKAECGMRKCQSTSSLC